MFTHVYHSSERRILGCLLTLAILLAATVMAAAQSSPFAPGWDLDPDRSNIRFQSIKNTKDGMKVESSTFATFTGEIDPSGSAEVKVLLDSVDTLVDLRNVRMRFLFFETFLYPEATISLELTEDMIADLPASRRTTINLPYIFDLHGVQIPMQSLVTVTMLNDDQVSVASAVPISIEATDFGLAENITKLEEAVGGITIIPSATVTFDFLFARRGSDAAPSGSEPIQEADPIPEPQSVALEPEGDFSLDACVGRFEILSRTGNIYFAFSSADLQPSSYPLLDSVVDIVSRCPDLQVLVAGHTDSDGDATYNQILSERRAQSVVNYLVDEGISRRQLIATGYGEERPVVANDTAANKGRNRRIEFAPVTGG
ncbi:OmpA family protein [Amaricoccus macauensis]|uniref:OmpA family protein n=1 Tax=Amaricoccus macauensis TaxID=57001 RepID=UPI003C7BDCA6